jgi:NADH-quinone oxidoreductase subunit I
MGFVGQPFLAVPAAPCILGGAKTGQLRVAVLQIPQSQATDSSADFREPLDIRNLHRQTSAMNSIMKRLLLADFWKGMILTFRTQNPKNIYTEQYPLERPMVAERYRGAPRLNMNPETGETLCIACNLCSLACPENLIVVGWHRDDATRRKVLTNFTYDTSRCMFCGLCEDACPTDCLELTQDFEMASYSREGAIWDRHRLEEGPTPARYTR